MGAESPVEFRRDSIPHGEEIGPGVPKTQSSLRKEPEEAFGPPPPFGRGSAELRGDPPLFFQTSKGQVRCGLVHRPTGSLLHLINNPRAIGVFPQAERETVEFKKPRGT